VLVLLLIIGIVASWLYGEAGLKEYLEMRRVVSKLSGEQREEAEASFGDGESGFYGGALAGVWQGKVWVWGKRGLRSFEVDEYSAYSYFSICEKISSIPVEVEELLIELDEPYEFTVDRSVDGELAVWKARVKKGDHVSVLIAGEEHGGTKGNLREMYSYDWWVFAPVMIKEQCKR